MEEKYLLWINEFIVDGYDFLEVMYPEIKKLYNNRTQLCSLKKPLNSDEMKLRHDIEDQIISELKLNGIPEYVLIEEQEGCMIEVVSGVKLNIPDNILYLRKMENKEIISEYINNLTIENVDMLNEKLPLFIKNINKSKVKKY